MSIRIERHDVFDLDNPATSAWPYRAANALHITTRERFIRSVLLFHEGDPLQPALLAESERLLRETGFLSPVTIFARPVEGGAEVVVRTVDQWTTELSLDLSRVGGQSKRGISLAESNFLGLGKNVEVESRSDAVRRSLIASYKDHHLLGSRVQLAAKYQDSSDGTVKKLSVQYPFYALETPLAGGIEMLRDNLTEWLWVSGHKAISGDALNQTLRAWAGIRLPGDGLVTDRLTLGFFHDEASFANWRWRDGTPYQTPTGHRLQGLEVGFERQLNRWEVVQGFRSWVRQEDIPLGPNWTATAGLSSPALGAERTALRFDSTLTVGSLAERRYRWLNAEASGRASRGSVENGLLHLEVGAATIGQSSLRGRVAIDASNHLDGDQQLTLGADTGLRGWDPDTFDGTSRAVVNLEWRRRLTGDLLHLGVIGMVVFADAGHTWGARVGPSTGGVRADAGLGLVAEITRTAVLHLVRVEVAFPDTGHGPTILVTSGSLF